jgi:LysM repeat protein
VAIFPRPYARYVADLETRAEDAPSNPASSLDYRVRRGDSLWTIAREHGTSVEELKAANHITGSRIYAGQLLQIPVAR